VDETAQDRQPARRDVDAPAQAEATVEAEVRAKIAESLGGARGSLETALPFAAFTIAYVVTDEVRPAVVLGVATALVAFVVRLAQRSSTRFVGNGLVAIAVAAVIATYTGRAETAFLPGIIQNAAWAVVMGASIAVRWPLLGFLVGGVIGDTTGWRNEPAVLRLSNRLTLVLMLPMVVRVAVQYPLYLAGEVGWLGVTRVALGWPLYLAALAVAGAILARGQTPMRRVPRPPLDT
jgi:hypothetical protein